MATTYAISMLTLNGNHLCVESLECHRSEIRTWSSRVIDQLALVQKTLEPPEEMADGLYRDFQGPSATYSSRFLREKGNPTPRDGTLICPPC